MLPKKHRLTKTVDVKTTTARGRCFFNPHFVLKSHRIGDVARLTVIVSVKVSKKAVVRNRIKRVIRESIRPLLSEIPAGQYAIIAKSSIIQLTGLELRQLVQQFIQKVLKTKKT